VTENKRYCGQCLRLELFPAPTKDQQVELRPYGPGGTLICFQCATASPDAEERTAANFKTVLDGAEAISPHGVAMITDHGLEPLVDELPGLTPPIQEKP
jgi:hypothetical protein